MDGLTAATAITAMLASAAAVISFAIVIGAKILRANRRVMDVLEFVETEMSPNHGTSLRDKVDRTVECVDRLTVDMEERVQHDVDLAAALEDSNRKRDRIWKYIEDQLIPQMRSLRQSMDDHVIGKVEPNVQRLHDNMTGENPVIDD